MFSEGLKQSVEAYIKTKSIQFCYKENKQTILYLYKYFAPSAKYRG